MRSFMLPSIFSAMLAFVTALLRSHASLRLENLVLRGAVSAERISDEEIRISVRHPCSLQTKKGEANDANRPYATSSGVDHYTRLWFRRICWHTWKACCRSEACRSGYLLGHHRSPAGCCRGHLGQRHTDPQQWQPASL